MLKPKQSAQRFLAMGLVPVASTTARARGEGGEDRTPAEEARATLKEYTDKAEEARSDPDFMSQYPPDHVHDWWAKQPEGPMKILARAVLGQAASSAPLENAFSTGADIAVRRRASLAPHRVEMLLVCCLMRRVVSLTPDDVLEIPQDNAEDYMPGRFTRSELITNLAGFGAELLAVMDARGEEGALTGEEEMNMMQGWSSLADWGMDMLDFSDLDVDAIAMEEGQAAN